MRSPLAERVVNDPDFTEALERVLGEAPDLAPPFDSRGQGLTRAELEFLQDARVEASAQAGYEALAQSTMAFARLLATSLTTAQVAARLKVDGARVRQRLLERSLYGLKTEAGDWRLPSFQFDDRGRPIPHLGAVLQALPEDLHPLEVEGWLTNPDPDLESRGEPLTPLQWLSTGRDVAKVVELAERVAEPI